MTNTSIINPKTDNLSDVLMIIGLSLLTIGTFLLSLYYFVPKKKRLNLLK